MNLSFASAWVAAAVLTIAAVPMVRAQAVPPNLRMCVAETDDARRLACFDREVARLSQPQKADHAAPATASPPAPQLSAEERFGRRGEMVRVEQERQSIETPALKELSAVVTKVSSRVGGELVITLDNGQVWVQVLADPHVSVSVHDRVTIKPGALKSFLLSTPSGRGTKVRRLR